MAQLDAYLFFDGTCADAMRFYERTLGGKLTLLTHADSPMAAQTPPESANRIMHARLDLGARQLMASDTMVGHPYEGMHGFSLSLIYPTAAEAKRVFDALPTAARSRCRCRRPFGRKALACWSIASVRRGWSTAR